MPAAERPAAPTRAISWLWVAVVSATALGSAYALHGFFRGASLCASAFAVFTLVRRRRPGAAPRGRSGA